MNLYKVFIRIDNNRTGLNYKKFCSKSYTIQAQSEDEAYKIAATEIKKIRRYKNAIVRNIHNEKNQMHSSWSINCEKISFLGRCCGIARDYSTKTIDNTVNKYDKHFLDFYGVNYDD